MARSADLAIYWRLLLSYLYALWMDMNPGGGEVERDGVAGILYLALTEEWRLLKPIPLTGSYFMMVFVCSVTSEPFCEDQGCRDGHRDGGDHSLIGYLARLNC